MPAGEMSFFMKSTAVNGHVVTLKTIHPMRAGADSDRFQDPHKVEKWFKRNCKDVLSRECTALEKGDVLTYLLSVQKP